MAYRGYHFFVGDLELPYAPSELKITIGSNNKTVDLINGNEINILKNPKLTEIEFDIELPRGRQYAFANTLKDSKIYTDYFEKLMLTKSPVDLVITRPNPMLYGSTGIGGTMGDFPSNVFKVSLEGYELKENAENAYDVTVSLRFKEYHAYGTVKQVVEQKVETVLKDVTTMATYIVKKGDCLWKISKKFYGTGEKWKTIYTANKNRIETTARKHGKKSSSNGWWIYPDMKLYIPITKRTPQSNAVKPNK